LNLDGNVNIAIKTIIYLSNKIMASVEKTVVPAPVPRKKKIKHDKGIQHPTSMARILKNGCGMPGIRCSSGAAKNAADLVDSYLKRMGECSSQLLKLTKKKTVTREILNQCIKPGGMCHYQGAEDILMSAKRTGDGRSKKRDDIGPFTSRKAFEKGIDLGKGANRISESAKWGLAALACGYVNFLGKMAASFIKAGKRKTILEDDIRSALEFMH
jgi:histone H3/H4